MIMMTCQLCNAKGKYFAKYINILICLLINFANCNLFVVITYVTRRHFHSHPTIGNRYFFRIRIFHAVQRRPFGARVNLPSRDNRVASYPRTLQHDQGLD